MKIIARQQYIEHIQRFIGKGMIIAHIGQRRDGKSYIIRQLVTEIEAGNPDANIIYINKEKTKYADIRNADDLSRYLDDKLKEGADNYLLIDEVQNINGFESPGENIHSNKSVTIALYIVLWF